MSDTHKTSVIDLAWPKGIFAITLFTETLKQTTQFYQQVFGLPIEFEGPTSAVFKFGDTLINLLGRCASSN